jgi:hypothetical protein
LKFVDDPLHQALGQNFDLFLPHLRDREERFVSDFAAKNGKSFYHPQTKSTLWIQQLQTHLTVDNSANLRFTTSPTESEHFFAPALHPPNSIVGLPIETSPNKYRLDKLRYYQVIKNYKVDSIPTVDLRLLRSVARTPHLLADA